MDLDALAKSKKNSVADFVGPRAFRVPGDAGRIKRLLKRVACGDLEAFETASDILGRLAHGDEYRNDWSVAYGALEWLLHFGQDTSGGSHYKTYDIPGFSMESQRRMSLSRICPTCGVDQTQTTFGHCSCWQGTI